METYTDVRTMETIECASCGMLFAATKAYIDRRRQDGKGFSCPNGHSNIYRETTQEKQIADLKRALECSQVETTNALQAAMTAEREAAAAQRKERKAKANLKRVNKRVHNGVCPCCSRHFVNLEAHMKNKHPDSPQEREKAIAAAKAAK